MKVFFKTDRLNHQFKELADPMLLLVRVFISPIFPHTKSSDLMQTPSILAIDEFLIRYGETGGKISFS